MEPEEIYIRHKKVQGWFRKKYPHVSAQMVEDFGSYCVEVWLSKGFKKSFQYLAVDFFRIHGTRMDTHGSSDAMAQPHPVVFEPIHSDMNWKNSLDDEPKKLPFDIEDVKDLRDRVILMLLLDFEFTQENVAKVIGVTPSRLSQILREMAKRYTPEKIAFQKTLDQQPIEKPKPTPPPKPQPVPTPPEPKKKTKQLSIYDRYVLK